MNAIAARLGVTDNAVRLHLAALERDGLIRRGGVVRTGEAGQPAAEYALTSDGEVALSSAYPPALTAVVGAIGARLSPRAARALFADAGKRLAPDAAVASTASLPDRARACATLLEALGARIQVETGRGWAKLAGADCPLAAAVRTEPQTCAMIEALLTRHAGVRVRQRCQHGDHPACRFELVTNPPD